MAQKKKLVSSVFRDRYDAERAFDYLHAKGYLDSEINVLMSDKTRSTFYPLSNKEDEKHEAGSMATEGMGVGGAIGTAVGATIAAILAVGTTLAVPLTGGASLLVAGPIAAALAGGGAGAVTGGILGGLIGAGMTEQNAQAYDEALRNGGVAIGVVPRNDDHASEIKKKFEDVGAKVEIK